MSQNFHSVESDPSVGRGYVYAGRGKKSGSHLVRKIADVAHKASTSGSDAVVESDYIADSAVVRDLEFSAAEASAKGLLLATRALPEDLQEKFSKTIDNYVSYRNPELEKAAADLMNTTIRSATLSKMSKNTVEVPHLISTTFDRELTTKFVELNLRFTRCQDHPHGAAAALREVMYHWCLKLLGYRKDCAVPIGFDAAVKDCGGNPDFFLRHGFPFVHCCNPICDLRDEVRNQRFREKIKNYKNESCRVRKTIADGYATGNVLFRCNSKSQACRVTAPVLLFMHSAYDMSDEAVVDAMICANASRAMIVMHYDEGYFTGAHSGESKSVGFRWFLTREKGRVVYNQYFPDDVQSVYRHDFINIISKFTTKALLGSDGRAYVFEVRDVFMSTAVIDIYRLDSPVLKGGRMLFPIPRTLPKDMVMLYTYEFDPGSVQRMIGLMGVASPWNLRPKKLLIPLEIFDNIMKYIATVDANKFVMSSITKALVAIVGRRNIGGTFMSSKQDFRIDPRDMFTLAMTVYLIGFELKFNQSQAMNAVKSDIDFHRMFTRSNVIVRVCANIVRRMFSPPATGTHPLNKLKLEESELSVLDAKKFAVVFEAANMIPADPDESRGFWSKFCNKLSESCKIYRVSPILVVTRDDFKTFAVEVPDILLPVRPVVRDEVSLNDFTTDVPNIPSASSEFFDAEERLPPYTERVLEISACCMRHRTVSVNGDGNCMFNALVRGGIFVNADVTMLKSRLLNSHYYRVVLDYIPNDADRAEFVKSLNEDRAWGNRYVLGLVSMVFDISVCVHFCNTEGRVAFIEKFGDYRSGTCIHLKLFNNHYDLLVPESEELLSSIDPVVEGESLIFSESRLSGYLKGVDFSDSSNFTSPFVGMALGAYKDLFQCAKGELLNAISVRYPEFVPSKCAILDAAVEDPTIALRSFFPSAHIIVLRPGRVPLPPAAKLCGASVLNLEVSLGSEYCCLESLVADLLRFDCKFGMCDFVYADLVRIREKFPYTFEPPRYDAYGSAKRIQLAWSVISKTGFVVFRLMYPEHMSEEIKTISSLFKKVFLFKPSVTGKFTAEFFLVATSPVEFVEDRSFVNDVVNKVHKQMMEAYGALSIGTESMGDRIKSLSGLLGTNTLVGGVCTSGSTAYSFNRSEKPVKSCMKSLLDVVSKVFGDKIQIDPAFTKGRASFVLKAKPVKRTWYHSVDVPSFKCRCCHSAAGKLLSLTGAEPLSLLVSAPGIIVSVVDAPTFNIGYTMVEFKNDVSLRDTQNADSLTFLWTKPCTAGSEFRSDFIELVNATRFALKTFVVISTALFDEDTFKSVLSLLNLFGKCEVVFGVYYKRPAVKMTFTSVEGVVLPKFVCRESGGLIKCSAGSVSQDLLGDGIKSLWSRTETIEVVETVNLQSSAAKDIVKELSTSLSDSPYRALCDRSVKRGDSIEPITRYSREVLGLSTVDNVIQQFIDDVPVVSTREPEPVSVVSDQNSTVEEFQSAGNDAVRAVEEVEIVANDRDKLAALDEAAAYHKTAFLHDLSVLKGAAQFLKSYYARGQRIGDGPTMVGAVLPHGVLDRYKNYKDNVGLIDATGRIIKHSEPRVEVGDIRMVMDICMENRVSFKDFQSKRADKSPSTYGFYALFTSVCAFDSEEPAMIACRDARTRSKSLSKVVVEYLDAFPGAGKTHYLVHEFRKEDMVVCSTTGNRDAFRARLSKRFAEEGLNVSEKEIEFRVRTLCGFLTDYKTKTSFGGFPLVGPNTRMLVDEAMMHHVGDVFAVALLYGCNVLRGVGDKQQIPFISRLDFVVSNHKFVDFVGVKLKPMSRSFRCPIDVVARLQKYYPDMPDIIAHNKVGLENDTVRVRTISPGYVFGDSIFTDIFPGGEANRGNTRFLFFVREDMFSFLLKHPGYADLCSTVHQFQGCESRFVVVFRLSYPIKSIFSDLSQVIVAVSRHTEAMVYVTAGPPDLLQKICTDAPSLAERRSHLPPSDLNLSAGGTKITRTDVHYTSVPSMDLMRGNSFFLVSPKRYFKKRGKYYADCLVPRHMKIHDLIAIVSEHKEAIRRAGNLVVDAQIFGYLNEQSTKPKLMRIADTPVYSTARSDLMNNTVFSIAEKNGVEHVANPSFDVDLEYEVEDGAVLEFGRETDLLRDVCHELPVMEVDVAVPEDPVSALQGVINSIFPSCTYVNNFLDSFITYNFDLDLNVSDLSFSDVRFVSPDRKYECMIPVLSYTNPTLRVPCLMESLIAVAKRNRNVPKLDSGVSPYIMAQKLFDSFWGVVYDQDRFQPVHYGPNEIENWLEDQDFKDGSIFIGDQCIYDAEVSKYNFITKNTPKLVLTDQAFEEFAAPQTVLYHGKDINAVFCVIFRRIKSVLLNMLKSKPNIHIFADIDPAGFADVLSKNISPESVKNASALEIDISKYDKSQGLVALLLECAIMERFGVVPELVQIWFDAHVVSKVVDTFTSLRFDVHLQRRSGDAATFLGNTMFLIAVLSYHYDVANMDMALFAGDDSLLVGDHTLLSTDANEFSDLFNLEVKFFRFKYYHFCSKFLIPVDDVWFFVPDPVKLLVRMGRYDLRNPEHVELYRISLEDSTKHYNNQFLLNILNEAVQERYDGASVSDSWVAWLYHIVRDPDLFSSLYILPEGECYPSGTNLPVDR
ncbi:replicase [Pistachio virus X]|uniref:Replicase n=1 Tax=Pistachio virus X TaxID=2794236 RepID=A0A7T0M8F6_9VIRU|nr:replicase [Pistachio virus X]